MENYNPNVESNKDGEETPTVPERSPRPEDFGIQDTEGFWEIVNKIKSDSPDSRE